MINMMRKKKGNVKTLKKVWKIALKKFMTVLKESQEETEKIVVDLKAIDFEMEKAILSLKDS